MEIRLDSSHYSHDIVITADNVKIQESISETQYAIGENGKKDYSKRLGEDITDGAMKMFTGLLSDIAYYRKAEYDSSDLIEILFEKLPQQKAQDLVQSLRNLYEVEAF